MDIIQRRAISLEDTGGETRHRAEEYPTELDVSFRHHRDASLTVVPE
jgi:hypothetical protein